jgi:hypothetical protein
MRTNDHVRERRLRRAAARLGYALMKSRSRTPESPEYGMYGIIEPAHNWWIAPVDGFGFDLDDVEEWLSAAAKG